MQLTPLFVCTTILATPLLAQQAGGGLDKKLVWRSTTTGDLMGYAFACLGDLNGDGIDDLATSAPGVDGPGFLNNYGRMLVVSGSDGSTLYQFDGSAEWDNLGRAVAPCGDLNADSVPDFAYSTARNDGEVHFISGATGSLIRTVSSPTGTGDFGETMESAGDVNGDGFEDLFVADAEADTQGYAANGVIYLLSGANGTVLYSIEGPDTWARLGETMDSCGDLNSDGVSDLIAGANGADVQGVSSRGAAFVYSGADGSLIRMIPGDPVGSFYAWDVSGAGDFTGDGVPDLMVGDIFHDGPFNDRVGRVDFFDGATGALVRQIEATEYWEDLGSSMTTCDDLDGDGVREHVLGANGRAYGGRVYVHSGASGDLLTILESEGYQHSYGTEVEGVGDLDGDGRPELLVGAINAWNNGPTPGATYLYEFSPFLTLSTNTVSASSGGSVVMNMDFPADWTLQPNSSLYAVLATGAGLGTSTLYGFAMPLNPDSLFNSCVADNYPSAFVDPRGSLDANGDATSTISFGAGQATSLVGLTFHLCAAWYEIASWGEIAFHGYSRGLPVTIVP